MSAQDIQSRLNLISNAIENLDEEEERISEHLSKSNSNTARTLSSRRRIK